jgi:hypothetical protein
LLEQELKILHSNVTQQIDFSGSSETLIHSQLTQLKSLVLLMLLFPNHVMTHGYQTSSMLGYSAFGHYSSHLYLTSCGSGVTQVSIKMH